uniref:PNPL1.12c n=2 Tax=Nocardiopsis sp. 25L-1-1c TaxID=1009683 RepID=R4HDE8_9ACTN|nr:pNPL1.12c [Nocardiopsis sp. 25L-1-1c]
MVTVTGGRSNGPGWPVGWRACETIHVMAGVANACQNIGGLCCQRWPSCANIVSMPVKERRRTVPKKNQSRTVQKRVTPPRLICERGSKDVVKRAGLRVAVGLERDLNQAELVHALIAIGADHLDEVIAFLRDRDEDLEGDGSDE